MHFDILRHIFSQRADIVSPALNHFDCALFVRNHTKFR